MRNLLIALMMTLATQAGAEAISKKLTREVMFYGEIIYSYHDSAVDMVFYQLRYKKELYSCFVEFYLNATSRCSRVEFLG